MRNSREVHLTMMGEGCGRTTSGTEPRADNSMHKAREAPSYDTTGKVDTGEGELVQILTGNGSDPLEWKDQHQTQHVQKTHASFQSPSY